MDGRNDLQFLYVTNKFKDRSGYLTFTIIGIIIIIIGLLMILLNVRSSYDIGWKLGPTEKPTVTGNLVTFLGVLLLFGVLVFYLTDRRKRKHK